MRVLVAGDPRSIHTARFAELLAELGHEVHVFSVELHYAQEEHLRNVTLHVPVAYLPAENGNTVLGAYPWTAALCRPRLLRRVLERALYADAIPGRTRRGADLARLIGELRPGVVFSLKMQNEGYTAADARALGPFGAPWVHFTWGTDIEFFGKHPAFAPGHLPLIRRLLASCDFHIADTERDLAAAAALGFKGRTLGSMPAMGGFDMAMLRRLRAESPARRDVILVKGRQGGYVGKALRVIEAMRLRPEAIRPWRVRVFMATDDVAAAARRLAGEAGVDCEVLPRMPYEELLRWYGRAAIAVSATDVDGTPGFLLEAMAMGAFPVHSDMASLREWVEHGVNGLLFPVDDVGALAACLEQALADAALRDHAARANFALIEKRADRERLRERLAGWLAAAAA
ncbi:MAG TPA: glycosyltransferase family 4 protein [Burkholderiales bacterium]|nr:glycosyltransferase family 4 protein [Burkholderiales bacterium]